MQDPKQTVGRRGVLAGVGTAGALAAGAALLPRGTPAPQDAAAAPDKAPADTSAGYRLTEHIKRYYQTTRV